MPARCLGGCRKRHQIQLTEEQKEEFNVHFSRIFGRVGAAHGDPMKSAVARIAINICRIIGIVALMR